MATMIPNGIEEFGTEGEKAFYKFLESVAKPFGFVGLVSSLGLWSSQILEQSSHFWPKCAPQAPPSRWGQGAPYERNLLFGKPRPVGGELHLIFESTGPTSVNDR
jgi:hypothetical protein